MAQLEILQCSGCGSPLAPGALACEYCGNKNIIKSKRNPLKITSEIASEYIAFYAKKTKKNPKDTNALYAMGLLYLNLKNYELAERNFRDAIDQSPLDADVYYYYSLSLLAGKSIGLLDAKEVERIEQYLGTAIRMEVKCKYLIMLAAVRDEYYLRNHLVCKGDAPEELFSQAADFSPEELDEITEHCTLTGEDTLYHINMLMGKEVEKREKKGGRLTNDNDEDGHAEELTDEQIEAAFNMPAERRRQFYDYRFEPEKPSSGYDVPEEERLRGKDSYAVLFLRRGWKLIMNLVLSLVLLAVCQMFGWGITSTERPLESLTVTEQVALIEEAGGKKLTTKDRNELIAQFTADSLKAAQEDSVVRAAYIPLMSKVHKKESIIDTIWFQKSTLGYILMLVILLPLILWLFVTIRKTNRLRRSRLAASLHNEEVRDNYTEAVELYGSKPSVLEMQLFILNYLSELVDRELKFHGKSEKDMKGKILFVHEFFDYKEDGDNYDESAIEYTIVLPEKDCVSVITSDWRVYEDDPDDSSIESISYSDIREIKLTDKCLSFAGITINIPDEQMFEYQDTDPDDGLAYSSTRTSDIRQFTMALRKLQISYKNNK